MFWLEKHDGQTSVVESETPPHRPKRLGNGIAWGPFPDRDCAEWVAENFGIQMMPVKRAVALYEDVNGLGPVSDESRSYGPRACHAR